MSNYVYQVLLYLIIYTIITWWWIFWEEQMIFSTSPGPQGNWYYIDKNRNNHKKAVAEYVYAYIYVSIHITFFLQIQLLYIPTYLNTYSAYMHNILH